MDIDFNKNEDHNKLLVSELNKRLSKVRLGGGKAALPDDIRLGLELLDERRFDNGEVYVRYRTKQGKST